MKIKYFIITIASVILITACNKSQSSLQSDISEMENSILSNKNIDTLNCDSLIALYKNYCELYKDDTICADYFFKAGDLSFKIGKYQQAVELYGNTQRFPVYRKGARALFLQGFISENNLKNTNAAKEYYNRFLVKYPNHKMKAEVEMLLETLNMNDQMLIQELQRRQSSNIN